MSITGLPVFTLFVCHFRQGVMLALLKVSAAHSKWTQVCGTMRH
jgi:hypothetical protein